MNDRKPTVMQFGNEPPRDWRDHVHIPTGQEEADDSEDGTQSDRDFAIATLGFDPSVADEK